MSALLARLQPYMNRRVVSILFLGFASGLPMILIGSTLQAWYTVTGVSLMTIGILTLTGQPYSYKPLWAPLLDRFVPFKFGRRRSWIFLMQLLIALGLAVMAFMHPAKTPWLLAGLALFVGFLSATQDTAIDAYRTDLLPSKERGMGAAAITFGYRGAMLVAGALALIFAAEIGWRTTYLIMAGLMVINMFLTLWSPNPQYEIQPPATLGKAIVEPFREFLTRKNVVMILLFILIYKFCDALALSLNTAFLIRGVGFSLIEIGSVAKIVSLGATLLGAIVGGVYMYRLGLYRSLMFFGFLQMASNLTYAWLAVAGKSLAIMTGALFTEYFCGALSSVAFVVFLTSLCDKRYTATQYALLSALMAVGRVFVGPLAAVMVQHLGWAQFYVWTFFFGLPGLAILWWLNQRMDFAADKIVTMDVT